VLAGGVRLRMFRPFPASGLSELLANCGRVGILDRDISLGHGGVLWSEGRGAAPPGCLVQNYMLGLGGGDVRPEHVGFILDDLCKRDTAGEPEIVEVGS